MLSGHNDRREGGRVGESSEQRRIAHEYQLGPRRPFRGASQHCFTCLQTKLENRGHLYSRAQTQINLERQLLILCSDPKPILLLRKNVLHIRWKSLVDICRPYGSLPNPLFYCQTCTSGDASITFFTIFISFRQS